MDRSQETSERTAAPPVETSAADRLLASAVEVLARVHTDARCELAQLVPPRPLPPLAFRTPSRPDPQADIAVPVPMPARFFQRSGPAFEPIESPPPLPPAQDAEQKFPVDTLFSDIDAEAAALGQRHGQSARQRARGEPGVQQVRIKALEVHRGAARRGYDSIAWRCAMRSLMRAMVAAMAGACSRISTGSSPGTAWARAWASATRSTSTSDRRRSVSASVR